MSEQLKITEENKKTIISFVIGLLVGGLLVYVFAEPAVVSVDEESEEEVSSEVIDLEGDDSEVREASTSSTSKPATTTTLVPSTITGTGSVAVADQDSSDVVILDEVTYPADAGWIGVRDYENGQLTGLLGVSRWNRAEGLFPQSVKLLRKTEAGKTYAVVFYSDNGDKQFNLATDVQIDGAVETFVAQ